MVLWVRRGELKNDVDVGRCFSRWLFCIESIEIDCTYVIQIDSKVKKPVTLFAMPPWLSDSITYQCGRPKHILFCFVLSVVGHQKGSNVSSTDDPSLQFPEGLLQ